MKLVDVELLIHSYTNISDVFSLQKVSEPARFARSLMSLPKEAADYLMKLFFFVFFNYVTPVNLNQASYRETRGRNSSQEALMCTGTPTSITNSGLKPAVS